MRVVEWMKKDPVLWVSAVCAVGSMAAVPPSAAYAAYIDWRVLGLLWSLMLVVAGLKKAGVFGWMVEKLLAFAKNTRTLALLLVGVCFVSSMLITNDVALITFVPLAILLLAQEERRLLVWVIVLQTLAANLGSMFTPLGNPQNLYLFAVSGMSLGEFLGVMLWPTAVSLLLLIAGSLLLPNRAVSAAPKGKTAVKRGNAALFLGLFLLCLLAVVRLVPVWAVLLAVLGVLGVSDRKLLLRADYALLCTFFFLFVFIGNMKQLPVVQTWLSEAVGGAEFWCGVGLSQVISNVPAAMLLSGFTSAWKELLYGVNIGGLGTLLASMASLISYKLYAGVPGAKTSRYLAVFTGMNLLFLAVLCIVAQMVL